jgi:hypothetical protein
MNQPHNEQLDFLTPMLTITIETMADGETIATLQTRLQEFLIEAAPPGAEIGQQGAKWLACQMSRAIWSAMPNPSRHFAVERLPALGRNDRCVSGENCKHKQCCGSHSSAPSIDTTHCWAVLCETLPAHRLDDIIALGRLPDGMIVLVARRMLDSDPERVCALVEPHFAGKLNSRDKHLGELLLVLCDAYDATDQKKLKSALLTRVAAETSGQPRSDALQRLATMASDRDDYAEAWTLFDLAREASPNDPSLSHLEVIMLIGQGRQAEAQTRAKFWLNKLERAGYEMQTDRTMSWLAGIAQGRDPAQAMAQISAHGLGEWSRRLLAAINAGLAKPIDGKQQQLQLMRDAPSSDDFDEDALRNKLTAQLLTMGLPKVEVAKQVNAYIESRIADKLVAENSGAPAVEPAITRDPEYMLKSSATMAAIEAEWHRAWPLAKPFSTDPLPREISDVLAMPQVEFWVMFLEHHPEAFNSFDILDDVAIALDLLPDDPSGWTSITERNKLFARADALLRIVVGNVAKTNWRLPWIVEQNRPVLRMMVADAFQRYESVNGQWLPVMQTVLKLNPNDNHGLRDYVINERLRQGDNVGALNLAQCYPDDSAPAISFGRILALYRLGRMAEAHRVLNDVNQWSPKTARWLLPARKAAPKETSAYGIEVGGDEEAWIYREQMRDVWAATPDALAWLKKNIK